jgi:hypothetical protein
MSLVVAKKDMKAALDSIHREFQLDDFSNRIAADDKNCYQVCEPILHPVAAGAVSRQS